jgi:very-short-patch-repair endonuclease
MNELFIILTIVVVFIVVLLSKKYKTTNYSRHGVKKQKNALEEKYGPFPCDGKKFICTRNTPCDSERVFCKNVMIKIFKPGSFRAQLPILLPSGVRRLDFAFVTRKNEPVAIEIDDFESHIANRNHSTFSDELVRQNELVLAGWKVLRFAFMDTVNNYEKCIAAIQEIYPQTEANIAGQFREIFTDIKIPNEERSNAKQFMNSINAQWAPLRNRWYLLNGQNEPTNIPVGWELQQWTPCLKDSCDGKAVLYKKNQDRWWFCAQCKTRIPFAGKR